VLLVVQLSHLILIPKEGTFVAGFMFDVTRTPTRTTSDVPYMVRVKATCALMGLGNLKPRDASQEAVEAAISALQTGEAFQSNAYADALEVL
jgi:hypothetical protein